MAQLASEMQADSPEARGAFEKAAQIERQKLELQSSIANIQRQMLEVTQARPGNLGGWLPDRAKQAELQAQETAAFQQMAELDKASKAAVMEGRKFAPGASNLSDLTTGLEKRRGAASDEFTRRAREINKLRSQDALAAEIEPIEDEAGTIRIESELRKKEKARQDKIRRSIESGKPWEVDELGDQASSNIDAMGNATQAAFAKMARVAAEQAQRITALERQLDADV